MRKTLASLITTVLVLSLSGCTVTMQMDFLHPTPVPAAGAEAPAPTDAPSPEPSDGPWEVTPEVTPTPLTSPAPLFITIGPAGSYPITSTIGTTATLALNSYPIQEEDYHVGDSFRSLSAPIDLALARPVTSASQIAPLTPGLNADWIVLQRSTSVEEPVCQLAQSLGWREQRLVSPSSEASASGLLPVQWSWPITTLCLVPVNTPITEVTSEVELWCPDGSCAGQELWVDAALTSTPSSGHPGWTLHRFAKIVDPNDPGSDDEKKAFCTAIGCSGGGSSSLYCWLKGC